MAHGSSSSTRERRLDIQGLRGLCILQVLLFHIDERLLPAGFFGVDIFFVISGFVITGHLAKQQAGRGIRITEFLAARARRLLPNASLVLATSLLVGAFTLPQFRYDALSGDVAWAAVYLSNFHFAAVAVNYFTSNRSPSAVGHFWSLSIEEQFYLVWPSILLWIGVVSGEARRRKISVGFLLALCVASFGYSLYWLQYDRTAAFFSTGTRLWELGVGAILALVMSDLASTRFREPIAVVALAAILLPSIVLDGTIAHPGFLTLIPILGTAALIYTGGLAGTETRIAQALGWKPLVDIGDRSYSIYLWHWPVLVLGKFLLGTSIPVMLSLVVLTFVLSELAFRYVENPIRHGRWLPIPARGQLVSGGAMVIGVLALTVVAGKLASLLVNPTQKMDSPYNRMILRV